MKRLIILASVLFSFSCVSTGMTVLYAQTLPATITASWSPSDPSENVMGYELTLDANSADMVGTPVAASGLVEMTVVVNSYGKHTLKVVAKNMGLVCTNPPQCTTPNFNYSPPATLEFTLSPPATTIKNLKVVSK